jgi:hypothetical protein
MRQHERLERSAAASEVRDHRGAARVSPFPRSTGVDEEPAAARGAERDRVTLPDVDHVQFRISRRGRPGNRRQPG